MVQVNSFVRRANVFLGDGDPNGPGMAHSLGPGIAWWQGGPIAVRFVGGI